MKCQHPNCACLEPCSAWHSRIPFRPGNPLSKSSTETPFGKRTEPPELSASTLLNSTANALLRSHLPERLKRALWNSLLTARLAKSPVHALQEQKELFDAIMAEAAFSSPSPSSKDSPKPGQVSQHVRDLLSRIPAKAAGALDADLGVLEKWVEEAEVFYRSVTLSREENTRRKAKYIRALEGLRGAIQAKIDNATLWVGTTKPLEEWRDELDNKLRSLK